MKRNKWYILLCIFCLLPAYSISMAQEVVREGQSKKEPQEKTEGNKETEDEKDTEEDDKGKENEKENEPSVPSKSSSSSVVDALNIRSPNTYALSKYGDIPVNYSTGVPNIQIPLMTLKDRGLQLDISLSYHASGIKVDEEAPWTGLGWTLNAGGVITRVIRGDADLPNANSNGLYRERTDISDYQNGEDFQQYRNQTLMKLQVAETNQTDNDPDIFIFNFAGYSGKFFFDENLQPVFFEYQDFKVQYLYNPSNFRDPYFIITTDDGVVYEFKEREYVLDFSVGANIASAWYLTKMTSPIGGEITFVYRHGGYPAHFFQKRLNDVYYKAINYNAAQHIISETANYMRPSVGASVTSSVLSEIHSSAGPKIELRQTATTRLDTEGQGSILNEIILKDASGNQQKKYTLHYSYMEASVGHRTKPAWGNDMTFLNYRLKLDSLREVSQTNNRFLTHKFEYYYNPNINVNDVYTLPYRLSPCQDHWGYYNHSNNETIFPNNPANKAFHTDEWFLRFLPGRSIAYYRTSLVTGGGTREPDSEAVKAGTLRKITYPTGGSVTFEYEPHGYIPGFLTSVGGIRIERILNSNGETKTYEYQGDAFISSLYPSDRTNSYYTIYYQNDTEIGEGRPYLMEAFGIPYSVYYQQPFVLKMDSRPQAVMGSGPVMVYNSVTERISGNGRVEYTFSYTDDWDKEWGNEMDGISLPGIFHSGYLTSISSPWSPHGVYESRIINSDTWPYPEKISTEWKRGHLLSKTVFNEAGLPVQKDVITYDFDALRVIPGYKVAKITDGVEYVYARNYTAGGQVKVKTETSEQYMADGSTLKIVKEYDYESAHHKKVTEERTWNSEGKQIKTSYYYPTDYAPSLFAPLRNKNIITPIDSRVYKENKLIAGTQMQPDANGNPLIIYKPALSSDVNDIPFNGSNPYTFTPHTTWTYHASGLPRSYQSKAEIPVVYLWGYNYQYPIAQIEGASYAQVSALLNETTQNRIAGSETLTTSDRELINSLRSSLPQALVTTYTYQPLVGMISMTDPRGVTVYYDYDDFGRLQSVRDKNNKIVESYEYNYVNP